MNEVPYIIMTIIFVAIFILFVFLILRLVEKGKDRVVRSAGEVGENYASYLINQILRSNDVYLRNVKVEYDGRPAEIDNVIINQNGIFIIEVKNYSGILYGDEDEYDWVKQHISAAGNEYTKIVKNPFRQVKRQTYLLSHYLKYYGVDAWINNYVFFTENNSPIDNEMVLTSVEDIDRAIHTPGREKISNKTIEEIQELLG